jgi:hypothetical protein
LWRSVLLVEETGVPEENHQPAASHWQPLSHYVVSSTPRLSEIRTYSFVLIGTDCIGSYKSNYHTITTAPLWTLIICYISKLYLNTVDVVLVNLYFYW